MDDVRWQNIPEARRGEAEELLLHSVGKTRVMGDRRRRRGLRGYRF